MSLTIPNGDAFHSPGLPEVFAGNPGFTKDCESTLKGLSSFRQVFGENPGIIFRNSV
jgi:hypothetical protein